MFTMLFDKQITLFHCITLVSLSVIGSGRLSLETTAEAREVNERVRNQLESNIIINVLTIKAMALSNS